MDKAKRKALRDRYKQNEREEFMASLPAPISIFRQLFDYLDRSMKECGGDFSYTKAFLEENNCSAAPVLEWLKKNGAGCDCEVLFNIEEQFESMNIFE